MELRDALRGTGAVRKFLPDYVDDAVLFRVLDDARFGPSGGNRQAWHVIVLRDVAIREALGALYLDAWHDYVGHVLEGLVPFSPLATDDERSLATSRRGDAIALSQPDGFAETIASAPVLLAVSVDLGALAATDRDLDRYQIVGGASVYPFIWNVLLAAHEYGLGGVMTTVATRREPEVAQLLRLPATHALAAVVALGRPEKRPTKLTRKRVDEFVTVD
ncbi:MAG: nitroreductase family protein, partial [Acidobacteriota bacterium]|nr:nitroreductase family protein [Acidobacteriota bacterium]